MEIKRNVDELGRTHDTINLTDEEDAAVQNASDIITKKYSDAGHVIKEADRESIGWALLGVLRQGGVAAVRSFADEYVAEKPNYHIRGYA